MHAPDAVPLDRVRRALVIKLRHHGDVLLSSPVFSVLKRYAPHIEVDALVYADTAPMLSLHPDISEVHTIDRGWKKLGLFAQIGKELHLLKLLRSARYDLLIALTDHPRGAWMARLLGAEWTVGIARSDNYWKNSFTHRYNHPRNALRHTVEYNLDALRRIGIHPEPAERKLTLIPGAEAEQRIVARLRELRVEPGRYIHIHPASRWFFKCWPPEHMAALIVMLQNAGYQVILTAAPSQDEKIMIERIQSLLEKPVISLAGGLTIKDMAALSASARLFIGVDSAPMHIAAAVGTPVVALFGPSGEKQWGPWGVPHKVVTSQYHPCRPCGIDGCGGGKVSDCLTTLLPEAAFVAVQRLLFETEAAHPQVPV
ncbi:MAG TPA: putative lipopolysaccharide heptosyltransferase III [Rhodocyclaceae bacterium]|nr:putative lipopolysaccharide heptosyltransferase III [Rhodocyclaceae bacterium]